MTDDARARAAPLRVLVVAAECAPFARTGGLGDVVGALPLALARRGIDVRVVMPLYAGLPWDDFATLDGVLMVPMWHGLACGAVRRGALPGGQVPVYFLEHNQYYDRPFLYGPPTGIYDDNLERFAFLSRGALALCELLDWRPDVLHANDWHTALLPPYLDALARAGPLGAGATVYTIHNLAHQGAFDAGAFAVTGLGREHYHARAFEHFGTANLTKAALYHATLVTTVSPTYAREIQTPAYGCGLDGVLRERGDRLVGVLNGIDTDVWNPATDAHLAAHFDRRDLQGKAACKAALQREAGLPVRPEVPVFATIGRLAPQKGIDVLVAALERVLGWHLQMIVLGTGDPDTERRLAALARAHPDRCAAWLTFDDARAHRIEAGADFFVMPSRFEPCGLSQLYSLRYGALPIVRRTGGLADTVVGYDEASGGGTGFVFDDLDPGSLADTIGWALSTWYDRPRHVALLRDRGMALDFSWERTAAVYEDLYRRAAALRGGPQP